MWLNLGPEKQSVLKKTTKKTAIKSEHDPSLIMSWCSTQKKKKECNISITIGWPFSRRLPLYHSVTLSSLLQTYCNANTRILSRRHTHTFAFKQKQAVNSEWCHPASRSRTTGHGQVSIVKEWMATLPFRQEEKENALFNLSLVVRREETAPVLRSIPKLV